MSVMSFVHGIRLSALSRGQRARVVRVLSHDGICSHRLAAYGLTPGAALVVLQTFPGMIFRCDETEFAIEPNVARSILVEVL
jgi:Fe2+ transport system protein FeoA